MIEGSKYIFNKDTLSLNDVKSIIDFDFQIELSEYSKESISSCRLFLENTIQNNDQLYYGINTGFGSLCNHVISREELKKLQVNLVRSHACGAGNEIDPILVKLMLLLKVNALTKGHSE